MQHPEVLIHVSGKTRAGFLISALQGLFSGIESIKQDHAEEVIHSFSLTADTYESLLHDLLQKSLEIAYTNQQVIEDIKFTLVTDKKAEGSFIARAAVSLPIKISRINCDGLEIKKNETGEWDGTLGFEIVAS